jgi:hypothetical protein
MFNKGGILKFIKLTLTSKNFVAISIIKNKNKESTSTYICLVFLFEEFRVGQEKRPELQQKFYPEESAT